jgi:hypothetical protein
MDVAAGPYDNLGYHVITGDSVMLGQVRSWWGRASARRRFMQDMKRFNRIWDERAARLQIQEF